MSQEVDERVVEMRFDNAQFEKNVHETMRSLEKLHDSLQLDGAEKGFEKISDASAKVDFDEMQCALENLSGKFSAVEVMGVAALSHITRQAVDAGEKLVKSLSLDQVTSGWNKYAQKTASVQTIMNATGKSITKVNSYLDKLMWYSDETSYGFTDMTASLGQLTAAGGDIDKMIPMIMGIANATAYAGKGASEFSRVIYNLNQSYSQGYLNLMDWKSVELAGVATAELKQQIIDTGVELGKIKKGEITIGTFGTTLSKKWADKEVMETAFGKMAEFTQAVKNLMEQDPKTYSTASKAIEALEDQYDEVTVKAFKAAQEAKSFSEAVDATKDAVSSGWLETFETIFGNYDIAKGFWTDLSNELWELFASGKDLRNEILSGAFDTGWTQLMNSGLSDVADLLENGLYNGFSNLGIITAEDINEAGSFGNALGDALKKGKISAESLEKALRGASEGYSGLLNMSDAELKKLGYTREEVQKTVDTFTKFFEKVDSGEIVLSDYIDKMGQLSGREHFFSGLLNILTAIESALRPVKDAFNEILAPTSEGLYKALTAFDEFTAKLQMSKDTADKVQRVFAGLFSVIKMGLSVVKGIGSAIATVFESLMPAGNSLLDLLANVGDYFVELEKSSGITETFSKVLDTLSYVMDKVAGGIQAVIVWITELGTKTSIVFDPIKTVGGWLENFVTFITPKIKWLADCVGEIFEQLGSGASGAFGDLNGNALWGFANAGMIAGLVAGIKGFLDAFKDIGSTVKDTIGGVAELLNKLGEAVAAWKNNKNAETLKTISTAVAILAGSLVVLSLVKPERLAASTGAMIALFGELLAALAIYDEIAKKTKKVGKGTSSMVVMAAGVLILASALKKISEIETGELLTSVIALGAVMAELVAAQVVISKWAKDGAKHALSMLVMAAAVRVLAGAVEQLADLGWDGIEKGLIAVGGLLAEVAAFSGLSNFGGLTAGKAVGILVLAAALSVLEKSVSAFSKMSVEELQNGIGALGAILGEIAIFNMLSNSAEHVLSTAVALTILSGGLLILSNALANLGGMTLDQIGVALAAMAGGLIEMGVALTFVKGSLGSAASFLIMSVVLNALVSPLKALGDMSLEEIGHGLLALGGALGIFAAVVGTMSLAGPIVIAVSAALSLLAGSFALLFGTMAAVSLMPLRMEALVVALGTLGSAIGVFIAGVIAGLGTAVGSIATAIAEIIVAVCNAIAQAVPTIGNALIAVVTMLCDVLIACLPKIETTLETLIYALCDVLINCTPKILETIDAVFGAIFSYIGSKFGALGKWIGEKVQNAFADEHGVEAGKENGQYVAEGYADGIEKGTPGAVSAAANLAKAQDEAYREYWRIASPSKRGAEDAGYIVAGINQGISDNIGSAETMMTTLGSKMDGAFRDELGIHSNSDKGIEDGQFFVGGVGEGVANKADGLCSFMETLGSRAHNAFRSGFGLNGSKSTGTTTQRTSAEIEKELENKVISPEYRAQLEEELKAAYAAEGKNLDEFNWSEFWKNITNPNGDSGKTDPTNPTTPTTTRSSGTKKTVAQQIEEKYKTKLEANKTAREVLDSEYELWQTENQYSADEDTLLSKRMENAAAEIANQTDRVAIAQAKYDEMLKRWGADKTETKEAYASLLSEKTSLAKLQADQYTGLFEDITKRYDTDLDTLEKEYALWTAQNDGTASKLDKIDRETEYQKNELEVKQKKEAKAKEQWDTLRQQYGESDLRTKEAWNDYLDAQTESLELQNDIAKQGLNKLDAQLSIIKDEQSRMQSRMDLLTSIYDDGSLKDREDAYKQAVEQYGENSAEARKAKYQGITTSILGTVEALQNMNAELEKTRLIQQQLADGKDLNGNPLSKDDVNDLKDQLLSSRSSMVSFAGALADAMGLEDSAKSAVVKLANAIQKNWVPISNAFTEVWKKASEAMGEEMTNTLSTVFKAAFSEEGMEIGTEFVSAIASAMQGDYAGAIISAATGLIDLLFTDTGNKLTGGAGDMLLKLFSGIQNGDLAGKLANIGTATANVGNSLSGLLPMLGQLGTTGTGAAVSIGGIGTALGGLGGAIMAALPELLIVVGVLAAIAAVIGGIAWFVSNRKNQNRETHVAKDIGSEIDKGISDGVKEDAPLIDDAVDDVTQNAMDAAKSTLGTISKVMGDDYDYTPQIVPVVDLTNVLEGADEIDNAFATTRSLSLDGDISRNLANQIDAEVQLQNGMKNKGNDDTLNAINGLAWHMDGIVDSIRGMKMTIDGKKTIGYIDNRMGQIAAAKVR